MTHISLNGTVTCHIVCRPLGKDAMSPTPSSKSRPPWTLRSRGFLQDHEHLAGRGRPRNGRTRFQEAGQTCLYAIGVDEHMHLAARNFRIGFPLAGVGLRDEHTRMRSVFRPLSDASAAEPKTSSADHLWLDTSCMPDVDRGDRFSRFVGGLLIAEGLVIVAQRVITLVSLFARRGVRRGPVPDARVELHPLVADLGHACHRAWCGQAPCWYERPTGRGAKSASWVGLVLVAACASNLAAFAWAVSGLIGSPASVEGLVSWLVIGLASATAGVVVVRNAVSHPSG